jgi:uncharacterized repeat protein (TIGR03837 family)
MNPKPGNSSPATFRPGEPADSALSCDIFCSVIDNFGDVGVSWRLAQQLAHEQKWSVRFWIDRPDVLQRFLPQLDAAAARQNVAGVEVSVWSAAGVEADWGCAPLSDVVVEAFGCRLPASLVRRMADRKPCPVWINLEYLSAEDWVDECHALPSPDPATGMLKYFFFPGFASSGGLLRERGLDNLIAEFSEPASRRRFLASLGAEIAPDALPVSLFCYPDSPLGSLLEAWRASPKPVHCLASESLASDVLRELHAAAQAGVMRLTLLPFLAQQDYDRVLLSSGVNLVRGEDSFVRAQWARRPFVWQPYRQESEAHKEKLEAFLTKYLKKASPQLAEVVGPLCLGWGTGTAFGPTAWRRFVELQDEVSRYNEAWAQSLETHGNLAGHLADFCKSKL